MRTWWLGPSGVAHIDCWGGDADWFLVSLVRRMKKRRIGGPCYQEGKQRIMNADPPGQQSPGCKDVLVLCPLSSVIKIEVVN